MLKYEIQFQKAVSLAIRIKYLDDNHGELDCKAGPAWADKMRKLIDELSEIINSLDNSQYIAYIKEIDKNQSPEISSNIKNEWSDVRENYLTRKLKQMFKRTQK